MNTKTLKKYPASWQQLRNQRLRIARNKCEFCGILNGSLGVRDSSGKFYTLEQFECLNQEFLLHLFSNKPKYENIHLQPYLFSPEQVLNLISTHRLLFKQIWLQTAHLDRVPSNSAIANLRCLCPQCHLRYDAKENTKIRKQTKREKLGAPMF